MSEQRIDPVMIDVDIATSIDFQKHATDYVDILMAFTDESALATIYRHTDHHSDPISSKINFYKQLNAKEVKIKDNSDGVKKIKTTEDKLYNKNIRDQLNDDLFLTTNEGLYGKPEVNSGLAKATRKQYTKRWVSITGDTKNAFANGRWVIESPEPEEVEARVVDRSQFQQDATTLADTFGMEDMSPWFVLWWMEKFYTSHEVIKKDLIELLGDDNEYFVKFSESVGQLKNIRDSINTSTTPVIDVDVEAMQESSIPTTIPGVAEYSTKPETYTLAAELSKATNQIFRKNLVNQLDDPSRDAVVNKLAQLPTNSHGCNLIHDSEHPKRMQKFVDVVREEIQNHLKGLYDVLELFSTRENYMVVGKPKQILLKVENFTQSVDLFKNKIKISNVSECNRALPKFGKSGYYNKRLKNSDYLGIDGVSD